MQTYSEYAPTGFDRAGAFLPDQGAWLVVPTGLNRDSGCLDESNSQAALAMMGGESETVEVHRFGHWACGWFEIIIVAPDSDAAIVAHDIESALSDYPVLDDLDYSEREWNHAADYWDSLSPRDKVDYAMRERECYHYQRDITGESVWIYGRMDYGTLANYDSTIANNICESLRAD